MACRQDRPAEKAAGSERWGRAWRRHAPALIWPLFALFVLRHYGYQHFPAATWGYLYGGMGALCLVVFLCMAPIWWPVKAWMIGEEVLTTGCSFGRVLWPEWFRFNFQDELCSQAVGLKLGSIGLVVVSLLALRFFRQEGKNHES